MKNKSHLFNSVTLKRYFFIALCGGRYWTFLHLNPDGSVTWPLGLYSQLVTQQWHSLYNQNVVLSCESKKYSNFIHKKYFLEKKKKMAEMAVACVSVSYTPVHTCAISSGYADTRHHAAAWRRSCPCFISTPWSTATTTHGTSTTTASSCPRWQE